MHGAFYFMQITDIKNMTLERLFVEHRLAMRAEKKYYTAQAHKHWKTFEELTLKEIERRANILPIALVMDLINSGFTFTTR